MKILLDTHLLIWAMADSGRLPAAARELLEVPENELLFSAVSIWEIAIKFQRNRPDFTVEPHLFRRGLLDNGYTELPVTGVHAAAVAALPERHKDPFDRLLLAQAATEGFLLLTSDALLAQYGGPVRLV
jgi:PIN domain nuclease of toxin-antitoxin system